ncbi:hypothetical protein LTR08_002030 [Meristemomyces frigidus]|nr:hypothetical protein LTR08_002030 [Meristemomyces frigidus]
MDGFSGSVQSRERIIAACVSAPTIGGVEFGNKVLALDGHTAVKVGTGVTIEEARNQVFAYNSFHASFHVPKVFDFFENYISGIRFGYLVMERIHGRSLADIGLKECGENVLDQVALAIMRMGKETVSRPGPIGGGRGTGFPWGDETLEYELYSVEDLQECVDRRLRRKGVKLAVTSAQLVISHGDLQRRNMIRCQDESLCIVDWATAGACASYREISAIKYQRDTDPEYFDGLLSNLRARSAFKDWEEEDAERLLDVQYGSLKD